MFGQEYIKKLKEMTIDLLKKGALITDYVYIVDYPDYNYLRKKTPMALSDIS